MDLFFFIGSLYSYFAIMRAEDEAARRGVRLRWRPFNLRAIMTEQDNIPRKNPVKMRYLFRDVERRATRYGLPFKAALPYPVDPDGLANRVAALAATQGWCASYAQATYRAWFAEHKAPGDRGHLNRLLCDLGRDADAIVMRAESPEIRQHFDAETDAARALGIFGAPSFVVAGELFWGDDRLDDALDWASANAGSEV